jgi:hypothetical protein
MKIIPPNGMKSKLSISIEMSLNAPIPNAKSMEKPNIKFKALPGARLALS